MQMQVRGQVQQAKCHRMQPHIPGIRYERRVAHEIDEPLLWQAALVMLLSPLRRQLQALHDDARQQVRRKAHSATHGNYAVAFMPLLTAVSCNRR